MKNYFIIGTLSISSFFFGQVGINTTAPKATLDIVAKEKTGSNPKPEGLIIPRIDREKAQSMTGVEVSTMVYIDNISTGIQNGIAANIDAIGYYHYDGNAWVKMTTQNNVNNIYRSNGILSGDRIINQGNNKLAFTGNSANAFSVDGSTFSVDASSDRVGIGTNVPTNKLHVAGNVRIEDGTQGANKVLVSDANGVGSWKDLPATSNTNVYNADGIITANRTVTMQDRNFTFNSGTGSFSINGNNNGLTRANFTNQNTGTSSRSDINIGTPNNNIYLGVDTGGAIFGAGKKSYIDNRSEGSLFIGNHGNAKMTLDKSGNIGIGTTTPNAAAILDVSSTTKGFLPPRMTGAQISQIAVPVPEGLIIYNSTTKKMQYYNGSAWIDF